ncbi:MAG: hypothetical protein U5K74_02715 [Gemmatimonadaceae bacterium]|nr:hypothetical protein [Gemmatimonadaceae bacterium]
MPRRSLVHTLLTALLGVWFVVSGTLSARGICGMHATPVAATAVAGAGHGSHGAHAVHHAPDAPDPGPAHGCTCLTDCCGTGTVSIGATGGSTVMAHHVAALTHTITPRVLRAPATLTAHLLPFANGPPSQHTA